MANANASEKLIRPEVQAILLDKLRGGCTRTASAHAAGSDPDNFRRVLALGKNSEGGPYRDFYVACMVAEAEAEITMSDVIVQEAKGGDWHAADTWLKKRRPKDWGDKVEVNTPLDQRINQLLGQLAR